MAKESTSIKDKLSKKFKPEEIDWVIVNAFDFSGRNGYGIRAYCMPYIKKQVAEDLADEVFGAENWENDFEILTSAGYLKFTITYWDSEKERWVKKRSAGSINQNEKGQFADDAFEIAVTYAEKRCWSKVGIGRYLKLVPQMEAHVSESWQQGWKKYSFKSKVDKGSYVDFYWKEPQLPVDVLPEGYEYTEGNNQVIDGQPAPPPQKKEATKQDWEIIMSYFNNIPDADQQELQPFLFLENVDDESGTITVTGYKKLSHQYAQKIITGLKEKYGQLKNGVPEKVDSSPDQAETDPPPEKKQESEKTDSKKKGVSTQKVKDMFDAEEESKKK